MKVIENGSDRRIVRCHSAVAERQNKQQYNQSTESDHYRLPIAQLSYIVPR